VVADLPGLSVVSAAGAGAAVWSVAVAADVSRVLGSSCAPADLRPSTPAARTSVAAVARNAFLEVGIIVVSLRPAAFARGGSWHGSKNRFRPGEVKETDGVTEV
jgi:hypothetical protein